MAPVLQAGHLSAAPLKIEPKIGRVGVPSYR
jgi:hypothetical protein